MSKKYFNSPVLDLPFEKDKDNSTGCPMACLFFVAYLLAVFFTPLTFNFGLFCTMLFVAALVDMCGMAFSYYRVNRNG